MSVTIAYSKLETFSLFRAQYVRVEQGTPSAKLLQLMSEVWNLSQPKLLISVTGGARNFPLNHRLKDVFRKGLIKAASSTGEKEVEFSHGKKKWF